MRNPFENMTLEELWGLLPIALYDHNPEWRDWADIEIGYLRVILEIFSPRVTHIGNTAIPGIKSMAMNKDELLELTGGLCATYEQDVCRSWEISSWKAMREVKKLSGDIWTGIKLR